MSKKTKTKTETPAADAVAAEAAAIAKADDDAVKAVEKAARKQAKAAGKSDKEIAAWAKLEGERKRGKLAARRQLLATTTVVRMLRDAPTSKGRMLRGATVRLPNHEVARFRAALPPLVEEAGDAV